MGRRRRVRARAILALVAAIVGTSLSTRASVPESPGPQWVDRYDGPGTGFDTGYATALSPDGLTLFVTGSSRGGTSNYDYATVALNVSSGARRWIARYDGPGSFSDVPSSIAVSPSGSTVFVTGESSGAGNLDYATIAYDAATGAQRWIRRYDSPTHGLQRALKVAVSPDGATLYVTGYSSGVGTYALTIAYDASTGAPLWTAMYGGLAGTGAYSFSLALSPDGSKAFVTGKGWASDEGYDFLTIAYDAETGMRLWAAGYTGPGDGANNDDVAREVVVSGNGATVYVAGESYGSGTSGDYVTIAYDTATGAMRWLSRYNGPANRYDGGNALALSPDDSTVIVTGGSTRTAGSYAQFATVAYDTTNGAQRWVILDDGPDHYGVGRAIAVSPDGSRIFVTGEGAGLGGFADYVTHAYQAASGTPLWVARYNGPGDQYDLATALVVSADASRVYVTGGSDASNGSSDITTLAYRATSCAAGRDETGTISNPFHDLIEPQARPADLYTHGVNCDVVVANGL